MERATETTSGQEMNSWEEKKSQKEHCLSPLKCRNNFPPIKSNKNNNNNNNTKNRNHCSKLVQAMRRRILSLSLERTTTRRYQCLLQTTGSWCLLLVLVGQLAFGGAICSAGGQASQQQASGVASSSSGSSSSQPQGSSSVSSPQSPAASEASSSASPKDQPTRQVVQSRAGLIAPSALSPDDFVYGQLGSAGSVYDEAGDLDVLANQQQIPTAQLMSAAGHLVPENFFLAGGSIPAALYQPLGHHNQLAAGHTQRLQQQQHQHQQQQQQQQDKSVVETLQQVAAAARHLAAAGNTGAGGGGSAARYGRALLAAAASPLDLLAAATEQQLAAAVLPSEPHQSASANNNNNNNNSNNNNNNNQHQHQAGMLQQAAAQLIDFNGYQLATQPDPRDSPPQVDLLEFLASSNSLVGAPSSSLQQQQQQAAVLATIQQQLLYEQQLAAALADQQQQQQHHNNNNNHHHHHAHHQHNQNNPQHQNQQHHNQQQQQQGQYTSAEIHQLDQMAAMASNNQQQQQQEQEAAAEQYSMGAGLGSAAIGPDYQIVGQQHQDQQQYDAREPQTASGSQQNVHNQQPSRPYGLPTKSSSKEPSGMLKPIGNPKTISSPLIDFAANNLPKQSSFDKLAEKLPPVSMQPPTVFSFSSQKDPVGDKAKAISSKKRSVMRQAEQLAKFAIKSFNEKFGTNLGDQTDIPFLLSTLGPLGLAQNILFDPTLLVTLLNTAEKTYFSDVLPGPAKSVVRPVLNIFRVPNKKRDKANLLNIISYLASGGQTASNTPPSKHRQLGIEKSSNNKKSRR